MKNFVFLLSIFFLFACKSSKKLTAVVSDTNHVSEKNNDAELIKMIETTAEMPAWFSSKAAINANMNGNSLDIDAVIQIRKDSVILIVIKKFGFEGARALITPDSVFVINRLEQSYDKMALSVLAQRFNMPPQFDAIQQLFVGNPTKLDKNKPFGLLRKDTTLLLSTEKGTIGGSYTFIKKSLSLSEAFFEDKASSSNMTMIYGAYGMANNWKKSFSQQRKIDFFSPSSGNGEIEINFSDTEFNNAKAIRFQIPLHYQRKAMIKN